MQLLLTEVPGGQGLLQREEVLGPPGAFEGAGDGGRVVGAAAVAELRQRDGVAFAADQGPEDTLAGDAGEITDDEVQLDIHLVEGLLHLLDVAAGVLHQRESPPQVAAELTDEVGRAKRRRQQAAGVQPADPLAVEAVGLGPAGAPGLPGVEQTDGQAAALE